MVGSYTEAPGKSKGCEVKLSFVIPVGQNTFSCKSGWFTQSWFEGERIASLNKIDSAEVCPRSWGFGVCWYFLWKFARSCGFANLLACLKIEILNVQRVTCSALHVSNRGEILACFRLLMRLSKSTSTFKIYFFFYEI